MSAEEDVQGLVTAAGADLTESRVHHLLLDIAALLGSGPREVIGPGPEAIWIVGDRRIIVSPSRFRGALRIWVGSEDAAAVDDEHYRAFKYAMSLDELPYLWSLSVAGGAAWFPGDPIALTWREFFAAFHAGMDTMPGALALLPPAWLPSGPVVSSRWNLGGPRVGGLEVVVTTAGTALDAFFSDGTELNLTIPRALLDSGAISVPAIMAGLTDGSYDQLEFVDQEIAGLGTFPTAPGGPTDVPDTGPPPRTQSIEEVQALLAAHAADNAPSAPPAPAPQPEPFGATMPVDHALELVSQLALNNHDSPAVLAAWKVVQGPGGDTLNGGAVSCRQAPGNGFDVVVTLTPADRDIHDWPGASRYGSALSAAISQRFGPLRAEAEAAAESGGGAWMVGVVGIILDVRSTTIRVAVVADGAARIP